MFVFNNMVSTSDKNTYSLYKTCLGSYSLTILFICPLSHLQGLLEVVHDLFEEQTSVDNVVTKIMQRAQTLLKCERCIVMLKEQQDQINDVSIDLSLLFVISY